MSQRPDNKLDCNLQIASLPFWLRAHCRQMSQQAASDHLVAPTVPFMADSVVNGSNSNSVSLIMTSVLANLSPCRLCGPLFCLSTHLSLLSAHLSAPLCPVHNPSRPLTRVLNRNSPWPSGLRLFKLAYKKCLLNLSTTGKAKSALPST